MATTQLDSSQVRFAQTLSGAVVRTAQNKMGETVSVKDFGVLGDGVHDDTAAIQAAFDWLAAAQYPMFEKDHREHQLTLTVGHIHFPQGVYLIKKAIIVKGVVVISGVGTGYLAGTAIRQIAPDTHIFVFHGDTYSNRNVGTCVRDINFEFSVNGGSMSGYALYYPHIDKNNNVLSSTSHYIRNCRCGGYYPYGRFIYMAACNDVEITGNVVDVCYSNIPAIKLGSQTKSLGLTNECSDVRITHNDFFDCKVGIWVCNAKAVSITGNNFSNQIDVKVDEVDEHNYVSIKLAADNSIDDPGSISGVTITGNTFWVQWSCLLFSGSVANVIYSNNVHMDCLDVPLVGYGATPIRQCKIVNNIFHLANKFAMAETEFTYPNKFAPIECSSAQIFDSDICDNTVDANGLSEVVSFLGEGSSTGVLSSGMTIRNNKIINNETYSGAYYCFVPMTANELVVQNRIVSNGYPTNMPVFDFSVNGFQIGDHVTFDVDYEVICERQGINIGVRTGQVRVSIARFSLSGAAKYNIIPSSSIGDDYNGIGGAQIPTVTFSMILSPTPHLVITVKASIPSPITSTKLKAYNFRASGQAQIRCS